MIFVINRNKIDQSQLVQLKIEHLQSSLALAGYYVVNVTVPENKLYRQFQIDTKVGMSIVGMYQLYQYQCQRQYQYHSRCEFQYQCLDWLTKKLNKIWSETEKVDITMISESSTKAAVELTDYSELDLIKVKSLTWKPDLPASFIVSEVIKT